MPVWLATRDLLRLFLTAAGKVPVLMWQQSYQPRARSQGSQSPCGFPVSASGGSGTALGTGIAPPSCSEDMAEISMPDAVADLNEQIACTLLNCSDSSCR